jgi:Tfp pilus assembly protein PilF
MAIVLAAGLWVYYGWLRPKWHDQAVAANRRGVALTEQFRYEEAQAEFEEAARLRPDWIPARVNLGIALLNQQPSQVKELAPPVEKAKVVFREVLAKEPDNKHAHYCLGVIEQYAGNLAEAYEHYSAVNRADPEDAHTWLRVGSCHPNGAQSAEARDCFEKAIKLNPYLNEARYRLAQALLRDDLDRARQVMAEFEGLRVAEWETPSKLERYGEQGKYAEVIGGEPSGKPPVGPLPGFESPAGTRITLAPGARWATAADLDPLRKAARERFGGTVVVFDYNGDGRPDIFLLSAVVQDGKVRDLLLRNDGDFQFTDVTAAAGLASPRPSIGAAAADYDNDGFTDMMVTGAGEQHLFRNKGDGTFEDMSVTAGLDKITGVCLGCAWADLDQDCDLDLVLCRYADGPDNAAGFAADGLTGGVVLLENVGEARPALAGTSLPPLTTKFKPNEALAKAAGPVAAVSVVIADLDGDQDPDVLVLADRADPVLLENDRLLRFRRTTPAWATAQAHRWNGGLAFVATHANRPDLLLPRADGPPLYLTAAAPGGYASGNSNVPALRQGVAVDLDLDGWADAVGLGTDGGPTLLHNQAGGRLENTPGAFGPVETRPTNVWAVACADVDEDGNPDLLLWSDAGLTVRRNAGNGHKALVVELTGRKDAGRFMRSNASGVGCRVAAQTGGHWTAAERTTASAGLGQSFLPLSLGMGRNETADQVRIRWPDGINQVELAVGTEKVIRWQENSRKSTSCPVLLTCDGERFVCVTDFLGAGSMGELSADGTTRAPRPEESVKIEPGLLRPRDGQYVLKIAEPMDEVLYIDHLRLDVIDHPAGSFVFPDERFATADPQPTEELLAFRDRRFPKKATDHRGNDVTKLVLDRDRRAPDGFHLRSWLGFAEDHALTFDFGEVPAGKRWHLVLAGWTEYPYPESIYAAERAGVPLQFPVLERLAADGKTWEPLGDLGFPAGLPRVMIRPLPDLKPGPCTLRVRTNMQVYFDQVYLALAEDVGMKLHTLDVAKADLAARGFIQEVCPDGRPPITYDDAKTESVPVTRWKGHLTRTGDVTELLTAADDRFVVSGPGDEITVRFDASKLPPVPAGWERSFVLRSRGYSKDTAPYTATGGYVLPLPFRAMKNYPDFGGVAPPATDAAKWNTRPASGR